MHVFVYIIFVCRYDNGEGIDGYRPKPPDVLSTRIRNSICKKEIFYRKCISKHFSVYFLKPSWVGFLSVHGLQILYD